MTQERADDWMQDAKDLARAERELKIDRWVLITFEYRSEDHSRVVLHRIDIPVAMHERWRWLIDWRGAKLICQNPRKKVQVYYCYYDKRTGLQTGFNTLLSRVAAAKAQITKVERAIAEYADFMTHNDLFFDMNTDEQLRRADEELARKKAANYAELYDLLQIEVEKHKADSSRYKLFVGFQKLGEFGSILQAKQYADTSDHKGAFNLIGDKYRDSWYTT